MAEIQPSDRNEDHLPPQGRVNAVCREWLVHEDGCLAYRLQEEEFGAKYGLNRHNRRTVREDIPVAKVAQSEEEERLQREQMEYLQRQRELADRDAQVARQVMQAIEREEEEQRQQLALQDEELARQIQEKEKKRLEEKRRELELTRHRLDLEWQLNHSSGEAQVALNDYHRTGGPGDMRSLEQALTGISMENERAEDICDIPDFSVPLDSGIPDDQRRELQELQDEEIARLLQEQEHKHNKMKVIERKDEELARVMQEQEKLKARIARHKLKQMREQHAEQAAQQAVARSRSLPNPTPESQEPDQAEMEENGNPVSMDTNTYILPKPTTEHSSDKHQQQHDLEIRHRNSDHAERLQNQDNHGSHNHSFEAGRQFSPTIERQKSRENERHRLFESERQRSYDVRQGSPSSGQEHQRSTVVDSLSAPVQTNPATNIGSAIDPTYNLNNPSAERSPTRSISTPPYQGTSPRALPLTGSAAVGGGNNYYDIAESPSDSTPVQAQKRSTLKKKERSNSANKRSSCKQQ